MSNSKLSGFLRGFGSSAKENRRLAPNTPAMMALEPRMVFDAAVADTMAKVVLAVDPAAASSPDGAPDHAAALAEVMSAMAVKSSSPAALQVAAGSAQVGESLLIDGSRGGFPQVPDGRDDLNVTHDVGSSGASALVSAMPFERSSNVVVFIDGGVQDPAVLAQAAAQNGEVIVLDPTRDGLAQITAALQGRHDLDAIHIVSHGAAGSLEVGTSFLTSESIGGQYAGDMATIRSALREHGDLLVYGCDVGSGEEGQTFVTALAAATGADVAASTDTTGAAERGGDWTLETATGAIEERSIDGGDWGGALVVQVINPTGGINPTGADGLRIYITDLGQLQVTYQNEDQVFAQGTRDTDNRLFNGIYMAVGTTLVGPRTGASFDAPSVPWKSGGAQTLSGTGTTANPYIITTKLYYDVNGNNIYDANADYLVTVKTKYVFPEKHFTESVTVTPPPGNTQVVKFYHAIDTFLDGGDNGPAFSLDPALANNNVLNGNPSYVGVRKAVGTPQESVVGFAEIVGDRQFDHYYSGQYNGANLYLNGIKNGGDIIHHWDTNYGTDNGIAVQFTIGTPATATRPAVPARTTTFAYQVAFGGDTILDLDANNSSGATGPGFKTTFQGATGAAVPVVDADVKITNFVGDILDVTATITNAQPGDLLLIDPASLPPGITVEGYSGTSLTLAGLSSEAAYQTALKQIQFTSTGGTTTARTITFAMHNQLNSNPVVATTTLNGDFSPLVDLNSGLVATTTTTNNIIVNGTFTDLADAPFGWTEGGSGTVTNNARFGAYGFTSFSGDTLTKTGLAGINSGPSDAGAGRLFVDVGFVGAGTSRTMDISVGGVTYARLTTSGVAGTPGTLSFLNGAHNAAGTTDPVSIVSVTGGTSAMTTVQIDLPASVAASGNLVFSTTTGSDDIYIDNVKLMASVTLLKDATPGIDFAGTYTENGTPIAIADIDADVRDGDNGDMASGAITIINAVPGDRLLVSGSSAASGTAGAIAWTRTANGIAMTTAASKAEYAAFIRSVAFESTSDDPGTTVRDITVTVNDGINTSTAAHSRITVVPENDAPVVDLNGGAAGVDFTGTYKEGGASIALFDPAAFVSDPDNADIQSMTLSVTNSQPGDRLLLNGSFASTGTLPNGIAWNSVGMQVTLSGNFPKSAYATALGLFRFDSVSETPNETSRVFTITATDGTATSVLATSMILVDAAPDPVADAASGVQDTTISGNVLANDLDQGTAPLRAVTVVTGPAHGTLTMFDTATGAFDYLPAANYRGSDSFTYQLTDANGDSRTAVVSITVVAVNHPPVQTLDPTRTVNEDAAAVITGVTVADIDGGSLTTTLSVGTGKLTVIAGGGATISGNNTGTVVLTGTAAQINAALSGLTYKGALDYHGSDTLTLRTSDGIAPATTNTMALTLTAVADIVPDNAIVTMDTTSVINVLANDSFEGTPVITAVNGSPMTAAGIDIMDAASAAVLGHLTLNADKTFTFVPAPNTRGSGSFDYTVTSGGTTETATVSVRVTPVNHAPVNTVPGAQTTAEDIAIAIGGITVGDIDADNLTTTLTVAHGSLTVTSGGAAVITGNGTGTVTVSGLAADVNAALAGLSFTGTADYAGADTLTVRTTDGLLTATSAIGLGLTPVVDVTAHAVTTGEDAALVIDVLAADTFGSGAAVTAIDGHAIASGGTVATAHGTLTLNADGTLLFTPAANYAGPASFRYTVTSGGTTETGTVDVTVGPPVNDAPVVVRDIPIQSPIEGQAYRLDLADHIADPDTGDTLTFTATDLPVELILDPATGVITGTMPAGAAAHGPYTVTVTADDGHGGATSTTFILSAREPEAPIVPGETVFVPSDWSRGDRFDRDGDETIREVRREQGSDERHSGIVGDIVQRLQPSGGRGGLQGDRGILMSSVNRMQGLGGHTSLDVEGHPIQAQVLAMQDADRTPSGGATALGREFTSWGAESLGGSSARLAIDGHEGLSASGRGGQIVIDTMVRDRILYVELKSTIDPRAHGRLLEFKVLQADGRPLPPWISQSGKGQLIADQTLGARELDLVITAVFEDGTMVEKHVRIQASTGQVKEVADPAAGPRTDATFDRQLAASASAGEAELAAVMRALGAG